MCLPAVITHLGSTDKIPNLGVFASYKIIQSLVFSIKGHSWASCVNSANTGKLVKVEVNDN